MDRRHCPSRRSDKASLANPRALVAPIVRLGAYLLGAYLSVHPLCSTHTKHRISGEAGGAVDPFPRLLSGA